MNKAGIGRNYNHEIVGLRPLIPSAPLEIPVVGSLISGGFPNPADDHFKEAVDVNSLVITNPTATYMGYAWNDSMEPLIYEGAILILDRSIEARNGSLVAGTYDGEWFMKRFWRENSKLSLHSENPKYTPVVVREGIQFNIFGKITKVIQSL